MNKRGAYQKKAKDIENIKARHRLLLAGIENPDSVSTTIIASLSGQRRFAALALPGTATEKISLNALKANADEALRQEAPDGLGFKYLDSLRLQLKGKTKARKTPRTQETKKRRTNETIALLKQKLQQVELLNLQRSKAYVDLFSKVMALAKQSSLDEVTRLRLYNLLKDHRDLFSHLLAPANADVPEGQLHVIDGGKGDQ